MGRTDPQKDSFQQCLGDWLLFTFVLVLMVHRMLKSSKHASIVWMMMASLFPGFHSPSPPLTAELSLRNGKYSSCWWRINADCCRHLLFFFFLHHIWLIFNNRKWISLLPGKNKGHTGLSLPRAEGVRSYWPRTQFGWAFVQVFIFIFHLFFWLYHVACGISVSQPRGWNHVPCMGRKESQPLDSQRSSRFFILKWNIIVPLK